MMSHTKRRVSVILTRIGEKAVANVVLSVGHVWFGLLFVYAPNCLWFG